MVEQQVMTTQRVFVGRNRPLHIWKRVMDDLISKGYRVVSISIQSDGDGILVLECSFMSADLVTEIVKELGCNNSEIITEPKPFEAVNAWDDLLGVKELSLYVDDYGELEPVGEHGPYPFIGLDEQVRAPKVDVESEGVCCGPFGCSTEADVCPAPEDYIE